MLLKFIIIGLVAASNNFATAIALGAIGGKKKQWKIVSIFGSFEFLVPLTGLALGKEFSKLLENISSFLAPILLLLLGSWFIFSAGKKSAKRDLSNYLLSVKGLLTLALVLSLDNFIIGFSLGLLGISPFLMALYLGVISSVFTYIGLSIGNVAYLKWEKITGIGSGILLILLAILIKKGI